MLVVDASTTLEWFLPGQSSPAAEAALRLARRSLLVEPAIWPLETHNALLKLIRQRKLTVGEALEIRIQVALLAKRVAAGADQDQTDRTWEIAATHMTTVYDASYVELAWRLNLPLASADNAVRSAAKALGVKLI